MISDEELNRWRKAAKADNPSYWSADAMRRLFERLDAAFMAVEASRDRLNQIYHLALHGTNAAADLQSIVQLSKGVENEG